MPLLGIDTLWSDSLAVAGFVLTVVGFVATLLSLYYAIRQVKQARSAAEAAREAALAMLEESRRNYAKYVAANSQRYIGEAIIHLGNRAWLFAALRLDDVADQVAQLASADPQCQQLAEELRVWSATVKRLATNERGRFATNKWAEFLVRLRAKIDSYHGPFITHHLE